MKAVRKKAWKRGAGLGLALWLCAGAVPPAAGQGEINLTSATYVVNFDSMGTNGVSALPPGFKMSRSNLTSPHLTQWTNETNVVSTGFAASGGTPTNGGRYNWGATGGTDRAPGVLTAGSFYRNNGLLAGFTNNTGQTITQIVARFVWEQYRQHTNAVTNLCYFTTNGATISGDIPLSSNYFPAGSGVSYGFPLSTTAVEAAKGGAGFSLPNGGKFYLLFYFSEGGIRGNGWGVDDLSLTLRFLNDPPPPSCQPGAVAFVQQPWLYTWILDGGIVYPEGSDETGPALGLLADLPGARIAGWRGFRTDGEGGGDARKLQPGDRFRITLSGDSRYGILGCSLNDGIATNSWADRTNRARAYFSCGNSPDWDCINDPIAPRPCFNLSGDLTVTSQAGETVWPGVNLGITNVALEFFVLSSREFTVVVNGGTPRCDLPMLGDPGDDDRIDGFSIFCENNGDGSATANAVWGPETSVTNMGFVEIGADGGSRTIAGRISDGSSPACPTSPSPNRVVKSGAGVVALGNTGNTYTLDTEISAGTLQIAADGCLGATPLSPSNAHLRLAGGATLEATETFVLDARRGMALAGAGAGLAVAADKTLTYGGSISGTGGFTKSGAGTLVLSGTNSYSGATEVAAGTLRVSGAAADSAVTVSPGATLMGAGQVGDLAVSGSADPGNAAGVPATLGCAGLALVAGGAMRVDMANADGVSGVDWDLISASGGILVPTSGVFTVQLHGAPADFIATRGYRWKIMDGASVARFSADRFAVDAEQFLASADGGAFAVAQDGSDLVLEFSPRVPVAPAFSAAPVDLSSVTLAFSSADPVVIAFNETGIFDPPTGTPPAPGGSFAGGTVVYAGAVSPQIHAGLASCATYRYSAWAHNGTNYSPAATAEAETEAPLAPTEVRVVSTNSTGFAADWQAAAGAAGYRIDVSRYSDFQMAGEPEFVSGYSNRAVAGTSQSVTGLTEETTYYFRVRTQGGGGCASANSATSAVVTPIWVRDQTIDFPPLADQLATNVVVLAATASSGLPVEFAVLSGPASLAGQTLTFSGAGTVAVAASQAGDAHWHPAPERTNAFLVDKARAGVALGSLSRIYDGSPKSATVTTDPEGLAVEVTYDGAANAPSAVGDYEVVASVAETLYSGGATGTLSIAAETATNVFERWLEEKQGQSTNDPDFAPDADMDLDGMTTWEEFLADTDPASSGSVLRVTGTYSIASHEVRMAFPASTNRYYQLIWATDLVQSAVQSNLGWGIPGMAITNGHSASWYGAVRSMLTNPVSP